MSSDDNGKPCLTKTAVGYLATLLRYLPDNQTYIVQEAGGENKKSKKVANAAKERSCGKQSRASKE